jgi:hypothetical protein
LLQYFGIPEKTQNANMPCSPGKSKEKMKNYKVGKGKRKVYEHRT